MQTIRITASGLYERTPGWLWARCYSATSDNPPPGVASSTDGCNGDFFKVVDINYNILNDHYENAVDKVMSWFSTTEQDTIYLNGVMIQKGSATAFQIQSEIEQKAANELQLEQAQLQAQARMLGSPTAVWGSQGVYTAQVTDTMADTRAYNTDVAAFLATTPGQPGVTANALMGKPQAQSQPATASTPGNTNKILIGAGVVVAALAAIYFIRRKK